MEERVAYAGVGSRRTPAEVLALMRRVAGRLATRELVLRTGGAAGADSAFLHGAVEVGGVVELFLPWDGYQDWRVDALPVGVRGFADPPPEAYELAAAVHPVWERLGAGVRKLHARNAQIILGRDLDAPASFVVLWTPGGRRVGGTGVAWAIAERAGVPVVNLHEGRAALERIARLLEDR